MSEKPANAPLRILDLEFNPRTRSILVHGHRRTLDSRSARVFAALAQNFGDCVGKDELLRAAWPGQFVHENSLAKAISKLRPAISGSRVEIGVSYGIGYMLREARTEPLLQEGDAPLRVGLSPLQSTQPRQQTIAGASVQRNRSAWAPMIATLSFVFLLAGAFFYAFANPLAVNSVRQSPLVTNDPPNAVATILWVDDHPANNRAEVADFQTRRIAVHLAQSTEDALKLLAMNNYPLVISDLGRGEDRLAGLKMIGAMKQRGIAVPVLVYTVRPAKRAGQEAQRLLVAEAGAIDLAVTPQEVRTKVLRYLSTGNFRT